MQIIFATDDKAVSKIIRGATKCRWHHVGAVFGDYVIEARFAGVLKTPLEEVISRGEYSIVEHALEDEDTALKFALNQVGKSYDMAGLISFHLRDNWQDDDKWYCSELVAAIAQNGNSPIVRPGLSEVSPRDLWVATGVR